MRGRAFYKLTGSGNDFVFLDARLEPAEDLIRQPMIERLCERATGVGADGVVVLDQSAAADFRMRYFNRDGSPAMCGNASLCSVRLAAELGLASADGMRIETVSGLVSGRLVAGVPEIDLAAVHRLEPDFPIELADGETRAGFAEVGVPHLVVGCRRVDDTDVAGRGARLRRHPALSNGANVNFVSGGEVAGWQYRTYERGVERETLACGTGAVATALLLTAWGQSGAETTLRTRSGQAVVVRTRATGSGWLTSLRGEGRFVFRGTLEDLGLP